MSKHRTATHWILSELYTVCQNFGLLRKPFLPTTRKHHTLSSNDIEGLGAIYNVDDLNGSQRGQHFGLRLS